jgi:DNA-binding XRE family transcriptional regulator
VTPVIGTATPAPDAALLLAQLRDDLRMTRAARHDSLRTVGSLVGTTSTTIARFEGGSTPSATVALAVMHYVGWRLATYRDVIT